MEYNCFTMLCWILMYNNVYQLYTHTHTHTHTDTRVYIYVCMHPLPAESLPLPPTSNLISSSRKWVAFGKRFYLVLPPGNKLREASSVRLFTSCQWGCHSVLRAGCVTHGPSLIRVEYRLSVLKSLSFLQKIKSRPMADTKSISIKVTVTHLAFIFGQF